MLVFRQTSHRPGQGEQPRLSVWCSLLILVLLLAACTQPGSEPTPLPGLQALAGELPDRCRMDGAVQTWLLLPQSSTQSELLAAYQDRQVIEFHATVIGRDDSPALQPHRRFILRETGEGATLLLDYQGDPPPLFQGQSYRFIAWADLVAAPSDPTTATPATDPRAAIPASRGYELQVYDSAGLLFLGRTDVYEQDEALSLQIDDAPGDCPATPAPQNACVQTRQVLPATVRWGDAQITLYPGEDDVLSYQNSAYAVALFRNRRIVYSEPPCEDYSEHQRSLRIDRIDPLPLLPILPPITDTLTVTLPITLTVPFTEATP